MKSFGLHAFKFTCCLSYEEIKRLTDVMSIFQRYYQKYFESIPLYHDRIFSKQIAVFHYGVIIHVWGTQRYNLIIWIR